MWGFHAITPHVTVDTRLIVRDSIFADAAFIVGWG
jgi:hypothetical protein